MTAQRGIEQREKENLSLKPVENKEALQEITRVVLPSKNNRHWEVATLGLYGLNALEVHGLDVNKKEKVAILSWHSYTTNIFFYC